MNVLFQVEKLDYDGEGESLRISGVNLQANDFVAVVKVISIDSQLGARHTFDIEERLPITLYKESWDEFYLEKLKEIINQNHNSEFYAIVLQDGLANVCIIRNSMCIVKSKLEKMIPGKGHGGSSQSSKVFELLLLHCRQ